MVSQSKRWRREMLDGEEGKEMREKERREEVYSDRSRRKVTDTSKERGNREREGNGSPHKGREEETA